MSKLIILAFIFLFSISQIFSKNIKEKLQEAGYNVRSTEKQSIIFERADGSIYEKLPGIDKFNENTKELAKLVKIASFANFKKVK